MQCRIHRFQSVSLHVFMLLFPCQLGVLPGLRNRRGATMEFVSVHWTPLPSSSSCWGMGLVFRIPQIAAASTLCARTGVCDRLWIGSAGDELVRRWCDDLSIALVTMARLPLGVHSR